MYRGTTPTLLLELDTTVSLANLAELWATFRTAAVEVTKTLSEVTIDDELKIITVPLTQEETLKLYNANCQVQVRFRTQEGKAYASTISDICVENILKDGEI
jgi:hypothetical protein